MIKDKDGNILNIAPKCGMKVRIKRFEHIVNPSNPPHLDIFDLTWTLYDWGIRNNTGLLMGDLYSTSKTSVKGTKINVDVAISVPVFMLQHESHHSGYGTLNFKAISPSAMLTSWEWKPDDTSNDKLSVPSSSQTNLQSVRSISSTVTPSRGNNKSRATSKSKNNK